MKNEDLILKMSSLSDPTRLQIVTLLSKSGELCACELLEKLSISQGTLSHHMKDLTESKIVDVRKDGKWCHYSLNKEVICEMADYLNELCCPDDSCCSCSCSCSK
jgi:ArsR family transcriptional regulator, arsenate/arsenite/antimonite-responsive transcriptional repressor